MKKRLLSGFLCLCMVLTLLPVGAWAAGTPASSIQLGDYVQMGTYDTDGDGTAEPILWRCVAFEKVTGTDTDGNPIIDSTQTAATYQDGYLPLMLADGAVCKKEFDAAGANTSGSHYKNTVRTDDLGGSSYWGDANIRDWLNSDSDRVTYTCGNNPSYANEKGFLTNFSDTEKAAIQTVTQKSLLTELDYNKLPAGKKSGTEEHERSDYDTYHYYHISEVEQNYTTAYSEQITDKMFLLDVRQAWNVYDSFKTETYYVLPTLNAYYCLRSPDNHAGDTVRRIYSQTTTSADVSGLGVRYSTASVRPAFFLDPSSTFVSGTGAKDTPYNASAASAGSPAAVLTGSDGSTQDYASLDDCISAAMAASGSTVTLQGDVEVASPIGLAQQGFDFTLDLNGHAITSTGSFTLFSVGQSGSAGTTTGRLTVTDSSTGDNRGSITGESKLFHVGQGSELSLGGGIVLSTNNSQSSTDPALQNEGTVNVLEGGFSIRSEANNAIYNNGGTFNGNNISFTASTGSSGSGAALKLEQGTVTELNATVTSGRTDPAILVADGSVEITGGSYTANSFGHGALRVNGDTVTLKGGTFSSSSGKAISLPNSFPYTDLLGDGFGYTTDNGATFLTDDTPLQAATFLKVMAQSAQSGHTHAVSVGCETDSGTQVTFQALTVNADGKLCVDGVELTLEINNSSTRYTLSGGSYYLAENITLDASIYIIDANDAPVNLCLNNCTLDLGAHCIDVRNTGSSGKGVLNLCDCGQNGKVTSACNSSLSSTAAIKVGWAFTMYGGTVENTAATGSKKNGVGVNVGTACLYGGTVISENDNGLWVSCQQADSLTLSGNVTIRGGAADVYFHGPGPTWENNARFTLAGPLTRPAAPWRVAVDEGTPIPLADGWSTYMSGADFTDYFRSATQGLFVGQRETGGLELARCAITQQPAADNSYTVAANGAPASVPAYQWYPATVTTADITADNAAIYGAGAMGGTQPSAFDGGKWTASQGSDIHSPGYFTMQLKRGDKVTVTLATADKPSNGQLGLVRDYREPGEYVQVWYPFNGNTGGYSYVGTAVTDGDNTVITYAIPADGSYDLRIDSGGVSGQTAPAISATLTRAQPGEALTGQTAARLTTATPGDYLCRVTWPDGTVLDSNVVTYTPSTPGHTHVWDTARWAFNEGYHWHECTADCPITDNAQKDGYAAHDYDDDQDAECNTCGYTRTVTPPTPTYGISGKVTDSSDNAVSGATVKLMQGKAKIAATSTDGSGDYSFTGVVPGLYNVVAGRDGVTKTIMVEITSQNAVDKNIKMPDGNKNSVVEVKDNTPAVVVGGVDAIADAETVTSGDTVTIKLTVEKQETPADKAEIDTAAQGKTVELYLDLSLIKTVQPATGNSTNTDITDTGDKVLAVVVPYDFTNKTGVTVYRKHGTENAAALSPLAAIPATPADGTFYADSANGRITIYATKFSTYAIGYTTDGGGNQPQPPSGGGDFSGGGGDFSGGYIPPTYAVDLPASTPGGKLSASPRSASSGATVTLTLTPEEGYEIGGVTVTDQNGKTVAVTDKGGGKYTFTMPSGKVSVKAEFTKSKGGYADCPRDSSCPVRRFPDADPAAWYHDGVHYCVEHGLMSGYGGLFRPDDNLSRAEFVQVLHNLEGRPVVNYLMGFEDVPGGAWYAEAVRWAASRQIAGGYGNGRFGPNHGISREELAVMLWRYAGRPSAAGKRLNFADAEKASGWATEALCWAVDQGILQGKDGGILDPKGMTTRAEAAAVLQRVFGREQ